MRHDTLTVKVITRSARGLPAYQTPLAAGMDIRADLQTPLVLEPLQRAAIPTGLYVELPEGFEMQVRPRSGLAAKHGLTVLNAPGTIDADYRGEVKVILANLSGEPFTVEPGERIAQIVVAEYRQVAWEQVEELSETQRGAGGFGATGR